MDINFSSYLLPRTSTVRLFTQRRRSPPVRGLSNLVFISTVQKVLHKRFIGKVTSGEHRSVLDRLFVYGYWS